MAMKRKFTDLSQLPKAMFGTAPQPTEVKPAVPKAKPRDAGEDVLAYFSRSGAGAKTARAGSVRVPSADGADARAETPERDWEALRAQSRESEAARSEAVSKLAEKERACEKLAGDLASARKEIERLKGECGRWRGEARMAVGKAPDAAAAKVEPTLTPAGERPMRNILAPPAEFAEAFPGELREMVLSALSDARDTARQSARERRAAVLDAVLAANRPTGELERRRAELKQAMKDAGYYTDPHALESLGFKLISGHTHWKLEYAGIRMPLAKTPSDYRANLNMATDMANRCF